MKIKPNLNTSERQVFDKNVERLKHAGVEIGVEQVACPDAPLLRIVQSGPSEIHAGTRGGMALAINLRIIVLGSGVTLLGCEISIPGCAAQIWDVEVPEEPAGYRVLGWLDFSRDEVLNHRIFNGRPLPRHESLDGILVARSFGALPVQFDPRMPVNAALRFEDQRGRLFDSQVQLILTRHPLSKTRSSVPLFGPGTSSMTPVTGSRSGIEPSEMDRGHHVRKEQQDSKRLRTETAPSER